MLEAESVETAREIGFLVAVGVDCCCGEDAVDQWRRRSGTEACDSVSVFMHVARGMRDMIAEAVAIVGMLYWSAMLGGNSLA